MHKIASKHNPKFKQLIRLKDKKDRERENLFLIEGYREILRAQQAGYPIESLFMCPSLFLGANEQTLMQRLHSCRLFELNEDLFYKASYRDRPDGLLAVAPICRLSLDDLKLSENSLVLVCESIEKPGNLGSILRSADGAKVDAVIVCDKKTDVFNPNVVRSSIGTLFSVPVVEASKVQVYDFLRANNLQIVATTPHSDLIYTRANLQKNIALLMGTEQLGLSDFWMEKADILIKIPMYGMADSLNVASAATLVLYEARRQMT